jgi:hypothetical protein
VNQQRDERIKDWIPCRQFWQPFYRPEDPGYWYFDNLEDPNDRGYDALRRLFLIEMSRTLPAKFAADARPVTAHDPSTQPVLPTRKVDQTPDSCLDD